MEFSTFTNQPKIGVSDSKAMGCDHVVKHQLDASLSAFDGRQNSAWSKATLWQGSNVFSAGRSVFSAGRSVFSAERSVFSAESSVFSAESSVFSAEKSMSVVGHQGSVDQSSVDQSLVITGGSVLGANGTGVSGTGIAAAVHATVAPNATEADRDATVGDAYNRNGNTRGKPPRIGPPILS